MVAYRPNLELSRSEVSSSNPCYDKVDNEYEMMSSLHYEVEAKVSETEVSPTMKNKLQCYNVCKFNHSLITAVCTLYNRIHKYIIHKLDRTQLTNTVSYSSRFALLLY